MERLGKSIVDNLCETPHEAIERFREIPKIKVDLPPGEVAIGAVPRETNWHLPFQRQQELYNTVRPEKSIARAKAFIMRQEKIWINHPDVSFNLLPQPLFIHEKVVQVLEKYAKDYVKHAPEEPTWVQENRGVPSLIGRFDVVISPDGSIGICEDDFEASLWGDSHEYNQILETHITGIFQELEEEGFRPVSTELPEVLSTSGPIVLRRHGNLVDIVNHPDDVSSSYFYQHNDSGAQGASLPYVHPHDLKENNLVVARGRRDGIFIDAREELPCLLSFDHYMDKVVDKLLIPGRLRDCKISLPAMGLGVLATRQVALDAADKMLKSDEVESVVIKKLFGARTGGVVPYTHGNRGISQFNRPQAERRLGRNEDRFNKYVVMQPEYIHPTAKDLSLQFRFNDYENIIRQPFVNEEDMQGLLPGHEEENRVICRIFINHQTGKVIGGLAAGLKGHISHNDKKAAVWPLFCEGVTADRRVLPYYSSVEFGENDWDYLDKQVAEFAALALRKSIVGQTSQKNSTA